MKFNPNIFKLKMNLPSILVHLSNLLTMSCFIFFIGTFAPLPKASAENTANQTPSNYPQISSYELAKSTNALSDSDDEDRSGFNECFNGVIEEFSAEEDNRLNNLTALPSGIQMLKNLKSMAAVERYFNESCGTFKADYMKAQIQREAQEILIQPELSSQIESQEIQYYTSIIQDSLTLVDPKNTQSYQTIFNETQAIRDLANFIATSDLGLSNIQLKPEMLEMTSKAVSQVKKLPFELQLSFIGTLLNSADDARHCSGYCQLLYAQIIGLLLQNADMKDEFLKRLEIGQYSGLHALKLALMKGRPLTIKELDAYEPAVQICGIKSLWHEVLTKIDQTKLYNYISMNKDQCGNYIELFVKNNQAKLIVNNHQEKRKIEIKFKVKSAAEFFKNMTEFAKDSD